MVIFRSVLLRMKNVQTKVVDGIKTHFMFNNFFFPENRAVYEIMCKNTAELDRSHITLWFMPTAHWIPKATNSLYIYNLSFLYGEIIDASCGNKQIQNKDKIQSICYLNSVFRTYTASREANFSFVPTPTVQI